MNTELFLLLYNLTGRNAAFDRVVFMIAEYGDSVMIAATAVALAFFFVLDRDWKRRRWIEWTREVLVMAVAVVVPWSATALLKVLFHAPRPFVTLAGVRPLVVESPFTSFPSGHATVFFALATTMGLFHRGLGRFFFGCATLIAVSRVVSGVHYPLDILAGAAIGISFAFLSTIFLRKNK